MKRVVIAKTGSAPREVVSEQGDFEHWIVDRLDHPALQTRVVDVQQGQVLPAAGAIDGVVVTGSAAMVTERLPWSEALATWLVGCVRRSVPVLGICYGHQLLAQALGGRVGWNPAGREIGTVEVEGLPGMQADRLFQSMPRRMTVQETHRESVLELPEAAVRLAENAHDSHQAVRFAPLAWGVQFHPEFDARVSNGYLAVRASELAAEGMDPEVLRRAVRDSEDGRRLLGRFAEIVSEAIPSRK
ncbi:MAG: glutamine amidotransferase [Myxococcota bacterium]|nr:glutamine amidotransferase [Myxococcota bacterium]